MKVILNTAQDNLGQAGDIVNVKDGYARNFLLPRRIASEATGNNVRALEHQKRLIADRQRKERKEFEAQAAKISEASITIPVQVGEEGKLFGSVTNKDIAEALSREGFDIDKRKIRLEEPIKELGSFVIPINLHPDVVAQLPVHVVSAQV